MELSLYLWLHQNKFSFCSMCRPYLAVYRSMFSTIYSSYHYIFGYHLSGSSIIPRFVREHLSDDLYDKVYLRFCTLRLCYSLFVFPLFLSFEKQVSWNFLRLVDSFYEITMLFLCIRFAVCFSNCRSNCSLSIATFSLPQPLWTTVLIRRYFFKTYAEHIAFHSQLTLIYLGTSVSQRLM